MRLEAALAWKTCTFGLTKKLPCLDSTVSFTKATITLCDLSSRFFCIDATLLCEFESDKI